MIKDLTDNCVRRSNASDYKFSSGNYHRLELLDEAALEAAVIERSSYCIEKCCVFFETKRPSADIRFDLKGRAAGQLRSERGVLTQRFCLRFNASLLSKNREAFFIEVVPHEVSHLFAYLVHGTKIKPHGKEWRGIMRDVFDLPGRVTHTFEVQEAERVLFTYFCNCRNRTHELSLIRHNKVQRRRANYRCRDCNAILSSDR